MSEWAAEAVVDCELARRLIRSQFRDLSASRVDPVGDGWDVTVFRVDERWLFRFPRRSIVLPGLRREIAVLPLLAPRLPVGIPVTVFVGEPTSEFPFPFVGARYLPGQELGADEQTAVADLGVELGRFLRMLHGIDPADVAGGDLPLDPLGRGEMAKRVPLTLSRLDDLASAGIWSAPGGIRELVRSTIELPRARSRTILHGDLHFRQILVKRGRLSGVVDWIDICQGDPAIDLAVYWALIGPADRQRFRVAYGPIGTAELRRARVLAFYLWGSVALQAHEQGCATIEREAIAGLNRASDPPA